MFECLHKKVELIGRKEWQGLLQYVAKLHQRSVRPAEPPFQYDWEEIGPGYHLRPAFGHWDIIHECIDTLEYEPEHTKRQLFNLLGTQREDGSLPTVVMMKYWPGDDNSGCTHPPIWPILADDYYRKTEDADFISFCLEGLLKQISWFENERQCTDGGFYYLECAGEKTNWESGVDQGVRFDACPARPCACIDACCHVYLMYQCAARWAESLDTRHSQLKAKADALKSFIQNELFHEETGFFVDRWVVDDEELNITFEGMWSIVAGVATKEQADRVINENLLNRNVFFTEHPISTVAVESPKFELRMWRGPAWNSMTYWAARGCCNYGHNHAAGVLLERAINQTAKKFAETGTVWEFYDPFGDDQMKLSRKVGTVQNVPCQDYLGHNPILAMCRLWESAHKQDSGCDNEAGPNSMVTTLGAAKETVTHKPADPTENDTLAS